MAVGTTASIFAVVFTLERLIEARLHTAVAPLTFSFSTIYICSPAIESREVILLAGFCIPPSTVTISSSSNVAMLPSLNMILIR